MVIKEGLGEGDPTPRITVNGTGQEKTSCPIMGYGVVKRHLVVASQKNNKLGCFIKYILTEIYYLVKTPRKQPSIIFILCIWSH